MSSFLVRLWQTVSKQRRSVGRDLEGNRFYESNVIDHQRPRRTVEYKKSGDVWDTATGISRLSAQWTAWLAHTRTNPPTLEELNIDRARQEKVAYNVARLREKDEEELRRRPQSSPILPLLKSNPTPADVPESMSPQAPPSQPIGPTPEPQTWVPRSARRS